MNEIMMEIERESSMDTNIETEVGFEFNILHLNI
jgi:hypothetical protein